MEDLYSNIRNRTRYLEQTHEPVNIGEGCCKISAPCTGPSTPATEILELMKDNINIITNRLRDISRASAILVSTDTRLTFRTGAIGGEVGRLGLKKSISVLSIMNDRGLGLMKTSGHT